MKLVVPKNLSDDKEEVEEFVSFIRSSIQSKAMKMIEDSAYSVLDKGLSEYISDSKNYSAKVLFISAVNRLEIIEDSDNYIIKVSNSKIGKSTKTDDSIVRFIEYGTLTQQPLHNLSILFREYSKSIWQIFRQFDRNYFTR